MLARKSQWPAGTPTNDSAGVGEVGEYITASLASGSATSLVSATAKTVISISLTAGDWDVEGIVDYIFGATTNVLALNAGTSIVNNTLGADDTFAGITNATAGIVYNGTYKYRIVAPRQRISINATTTVYLIAYGDFSVSTLTAHGMIRARRVR